MKKGRKNGCPVNIKNWLVEILEPGSSDKWLRIYGLNSLTRGISGETEDGSADTDDWAEPYITKRSGTLELSGTKQVVASTGEADPGQDLLDYFAEQSGCDSDATIRFIDPYGIGWIADYVVTSAEDAADESGNTRSWSLEQVGAAEKLPYVQVKGVEMKESGEKKTELQMQVGDGPKLITVAFTPEDASNTRFRVSNSKPRGLQISDITEKGFSITPLAECEAKITVTSVNNAMKAELSVTVSAAAE